MSFHRVNLCLLPVLRSKTKTLREHNAVIHELLKCFVFRQIKVLNELSINTFEASQLLSSKKTQIGSKNIVLDMPSVDAELSNGSRTWKSMTMLQYLLDIYYKHNRTISSVFIVQKKQTGWLKNQYKFIHIPREPQGTNVMFKPLFKQVLFAYWIGTHGSMSLGFFFVDLLTDASRKQAFKASHLFTMHWKLSADYHDTLTKRKDTKCWLLICKFVLKIVCNWRLTNLTLACTQDHRTFLKIDPSSGLKLIDNQYRPVASCTP